jgi:hypothetical protein
MNRAYRVVGAVMIVSALAGVAWVKARPRPLPTIVDNVSCPECALPPAMAGKGEPTPAIPTGSGLPCLAEFGSDECEACRKMSGVMEGLGPRLHGAVDVVRIDSDDYPAAAQEWKLRMIPTQVAVSADGRELWRHEGDIEPDELLAELAGVGIVAPAQVPPTGSGD